ncbi:hypothetical protein GCM10022402_17460 [Salinactinospora qingdaonensis]|uniref:Uncharacterized protein n=1 Tax=Salinactinospora qingdaonensis TaxID=702744 RepID=A0ABP7FEQ9_9ACTN
MAQVVQVNILKAPALRADAPALWGALGLRAAARSRTHPTGRQRRKTRVPTGFTGNAPETERRAPHGAEQVRTAPHHPLSRVLWLLVFWDPWHTIARPCLSVVTDPSAIEHHGPETVVARSWGWGRWLGTVAEAPPLGLLRRPL